MKNILILFVCFVFAGKVKAAADTTRTYSVKLAKADIKNGNIKFLLRGGIVSSVKKGQEIFEKKYKIKYSDFGCVMPSGLSIEDYNKTVAIYMDKIFGIGWRVDVRRDVQGI
ncbi:FEKKY domain-containing protein [Pedobacter jamesrossensis]|uniref:Uncharacterized protein n=1 Tax=Pedobacter jamesrossensis TaxID=1908238 RepID=A0ABV8NN25_9SPHI